MNSNLTTFYIVRHGETEWNTKGFLQGHGDSPLTENGIKQVQKTAQLLKDVTFDAVFSSDSLRARRTAEILLLEREIAIKTTQALRERAFGQFEGRHHSVYETELKDMVQKLESLSHKDRFAFQIHPDIETDDSMATRFITFLREIAVSHSGKTVLVASHGGMMRVLLLHLGHGDYETLPIGAVENAAAIKLESDGVDFFVKQTHGIHRKGDPIS